MLNTISTEILRHYQVNTKNFFQIPVCTSFLIRHKSKAIQWFRSFCHSEVIASEPQTVQKKKLLKVAVLGLPNAGKSTLINQFLQLNVCDVSQKPNTTGIPIRTAFNWKLTQIVFVDTPGIVSKKEVSRFDLPQTYVNWKDKILNEVDVIGIILDASIGGPLKLSNDLIKVARDIPNATPIFLVLNKVDLVKNKKSLLETVRKMEERVKKNKTGKPYNLTNVYFISALKNDGVEDVLNYLLIEAKESEWLFNNEKICDEPADRLICKLTRAKFMNILPQEVPYSLTYEVEYMEENDLGEQNYMVVVTCKQKKHFFVVMRKKKLFRALAGEVETDMYKIYNKVFKMIISVRLKPKIKRQIS